MAFKALRKPLTIARWGWNCMEWKFMRKLNNQDLPNCQTTEPLKVPDLRFFRHSKGARSSDPNHCSHSMRVPLSYHIRESRMMQLEMAYSVRSKWHQFKHSPSPMHLNLQMCHPYSLARFPGFHEKITISEEEETKLGIPDDRRGLFYQHICAMQTCCTFHPLAMSKVILPGGHGKKLPVLHQFTIHFQSHLFNYQHH